MTLSICPAVLRARINILYFLPSCQAGVVIEVTPVKKTVTAEVPSGELPGVKIMSGVGVPGRKESVEIQGEPCTKTSGIWPTAGRGGSPTAVKLKDEPVQKWGSVTVSVSMKAAQIWVRRPPPGSTTRETEPAVLETLPAAGVWLVRVGALVP